MPLSLCQFDDIFLSYVQHNSLPKLFQVIEDWWERVIVQYGWDSDLHELDELEMEDDRRRKALFVQAQEEKREAERRRSAQLQLEVVSVDSPTPATQAVKAG